MRRALGVLLASGVLVAATATEAAKHKVDSGIRGEATAGPTCPVERYPPDPQCRDRPYQATVKVRRKRTGELVKTFTAHKDGTFKVRLRPGTYRLEPANKGWTARHAAGRDRAFAQVQARPPRVRHGDSLTRRQRGSRRCLARQASRRSGRSLAAR